MNKTDRSDFWRVLLGVFLLIISLLFIFAISVDLNTIISDYSILKDSQLSFLDILKLDIPQVVNPIGPFGVFFGFWLIIIFGKFLSISLLLTTALLGLFSLFFYKDKSILNKIFSFLFFSFFFNLVLFTIWEQSIIHAGYVPWLIYSFLLKVFGRIGTLLISLIIVFTNLVIIFEIENVKKFFVLCFKILLSFFKLLLITFRKSGLKPEVPQSRTKKKKIIAKPLITPSKKGKSLNIVDHTSMSDGNNTKPENTESSRQPKFKRIEPVKKQEFPVEENKPEYKKPEINDFLESVLTTKKDREEI